MREATQTYPAILADDQTADMEPRFIGALVNFANDLGQSFGWWEDSGQSTPGQQPVVVNVPPPKDYTNVIVGVAAGLAAVTILLVVLLKK